MGDPDRKVTILDGWILAGATALATVDVRAMHLVADMPSLPWAVAFPGLIWAGLVYAIALIPIRLRRPRPDRDELWQRPGWVACVSVAIAVGVSLLQQVLQVLSVVAITPAHPNIFSLATATEILGVALYRSPTQPIIAIAATWSVLALGGRWKSDPGWIDRLGRGLGAYWIAIGVIDRISAFLA